MPASLLDLTSTPRLFQAQRELLAVITQLLEIDHRLYEISDTLPLSALYLTMEEGGMPYSGYGRLYVTLQRVKGQYLKPALERLLEASQVSPEDAIAAGAE